MHCFEWWSCWHAARLHCPLSLKFQRAVTQPWWRTQKVYRKTPTNNTQNVSTEKTNITWHLAHCYEPIVITTLRKKRKSPNLLLRIFIAGKLDSNQLSGSIKLVSDRLALLADGSMVVMDISCQNPPRNLFKSRKLKARRSGISPWARVGTTAI